ncbi:hypothetical protein SCB71_14450 [Herbiconiux sp. KACC 21604]|uniref:hypothetical protein n=1 Tax=unclassified Herbiconiux TaxID=2618217 RepID=UPI0014926706|nr:hypothetical protein [Herbiconiux sp. SALV-R1]QJU54343.1 hypothetical protein HL652_12390 [Herbiconiux sp. SALV-R1]WPO85413.1 hypothetical protein SCB71_14450 [Herbiconiux sp. KACC 21604]
MKSTCTLPAFGPRAISAHDIRGIRFFFPAGDEGTGGGGGNDNGDEKTLTQAEADAIVEQRLARERKKFDGFDDFKVKASKWDAHEAAQARDQKGGDKSGDGKGGQQPTGLSDADVQQRIDDALAAERTKSGSKLVSIALDKALEAKTVSPSKLLSFTASDYVTPEGDVDEQKLSDWVKENTTDAPEPRPRRDPSQGQRDSSANGGSVQSGRDRYAERHKKSA